MSRGQVGYTHSHIHANHKTTKLCYNNNNNNTDYGKKSLINKYMKDLSEIRAARIKHEKKKVE